MKYYTHTHMHKYQPGFPNDEVKNEIVLKLHVWTCFCFISALNPMKICSFWNSIFIYTSSQISKGNYSRGLKNRETENWIFIQIFIRIWIRIITIFLKKTHFNCDFYSKTYEYYLGCKLCKEGILNGKQHIFS